MSHRQTNTMGRIVAAEEADSRNIEEASLQMGTAASTAKNAETLETPEVLDTQEKQTKIIRKAVPQDTIDGDSLESQHFCL